MATVRYPEPGWAQSVQARFGDLEIVRDQFYGRWIIWGVDLGLLNPRRQNILSPTLRGNSADRRRQLRAYARMIGATVKSRTTK